MSGKRVRPTWWTVVSRGIGAGLLLFVLVLAGAVLVVPAATGSTPLTVLTSSMEPTIPPGNLVIVKPIAPQDIQLGDIITYQAEAGKADLITHRVISVTESTDGSREFVVQGDNNPSPDVNPVIPDQVKGKVWYTIPLLGWLSNGLGGGDRGWVVPAAGGAILLFALVTLVRGVFEKKRTAPAAGSETRPVTSSIPVQQRVPVLPDGTAPRTRAEARAASRS